MLTDETIKPNLSAEGELLHINRDGAARISHRPGGVAIKAWVRPASPSPPSVSRDLFSPIWEENPPSLIPNRYHEPEHESYSALSFINPATKSPPTSLSLPLLADDSWQIQASFCTLARTRWPGVWDLNDETTDPRFVAPEQGYRSQPSDP